MWKQDRGVFVQGRTRAQLPRGDLLSALVEALKAITASDAGDWLGAAYGLRTLIRIPRPPAPGAQGESKAALAPEIQHQRSGLSFT